jgi:hypothetical protein
MSGQDDLGDFLLAHPDDAAKLATDYIGPLSKGFGFAANNGWYNSARPHTKGFDLTATVNAAFIPSKDKLTQFIESQYKDLELLTPTDNMVPTVFGPEDIHPLYRVKSTGEQFEAPAGNSLEDEFGYDAILFPMVQLGIGVIPNTDLKVRFMPTLEFDDDFEAKMWGIGVLHNLNNYFPSGDELLIDLSLFGGFTRVETEIQISDTYPGENQMGAQALNAWTVEGLISYDLLVFTFYGGLGYNQVISDLEVLGTYDTGNEILVDPIATSTSYSSPRATIGLRIKVLIFALHGEYTFNEYHLLTAGLGINVN